MNVVFVMSLSDPLAHLAECHAWKIQEGMVKTT